MIQVDTFTYRVKPGEKITLKVRLEGLGEKMVRVSKAMTKVIDKPLTWEKEIPEENPKKVYIVIVEVSFVEPPSGAQAELEFSGSKGGKFVIPPITVNSGIKDPDFTFRVVNS
jgi:hypothetical protein